MKAPLHRIASRLYAEPWLIRQDKYLALCTQFKAATSGRGEPRLDLWMPPPQAATPADCCEEDILDDVEISNGIALLHVDGILGKHLEWIDMMCGGCDIEVLQQQAMALGARSDVHTVIIRYHSPGGAAAGVADCGQVLLDLAATKRLISYVDDACSGAYWLACAAPEIYGGRSCMAGSISAVCAIEDVSGMYAELGIKVDVFTDGDLKGAGIEGTSLSEAQRADIQGRIEHIGGMFKTFIATQRPSVPADAMRGQWFYGDTALELGLIDAIAPTLQHVIAMASDPSVWPKN
jgi:ClpP class serine protease